MNKEPANIEELRHCAILAEKSAVTGDNTLQSAVNVMQSCHSYIIFQVVLPKQMYIYVKKLEKHYFAFTKHYIQTN
jgi:hypothetical protein